MSSEFPLPRFQASSSYSSARAQLPLGTADSPKKNHNDPDVAGRLLTEEELAERHQRSVKTIRNLRVKGGYVPFLKIGRHVRYRMEDILAYEAGCLRRSTSDFGGVNG